MAINSYIKDFTRYPAGFNRTISGITRTVTYTTNVDSVAISDDVNDGGGVNQLKVFRSQFDTPAFTTPTSQTRVTDIVSYYVANIANHTANNTAPYLFREFRGAETFYVTFITGNRQTCARRDNNYSCGFFPSWKCIVCAVFGRALGFINETKDKYRCFRWTYTDNASFTVQVRGGYGATGAFSLRLYQGNTGALISEQVAVENTNVVFSNLNGSYSGKDRVNIGPYRLEVEDFITGQTITEYITVPYCNDPSYPNFVVKQKTNIQTFAPGTSPAASATNSIWLLPTVADTPPEGELTSAEFVRSTCTATTLRFNALLYTNSATVTYQFSYQLSTGGAYVNVGAAGDVLAGSADTLVSVTATINTDAPSVKWRLTATNAAGTTILDSTNNAELDAPVVFIDNTSFSVIATPSTPARPGVPAVPNSITYSAQTSACRPYSVNAYYWNTTTFPDIETDLRTATASALATFPAGGTLMGPTKNITTTAMTTNTWTLDSPTGGQDYVIVIQAVSNVAAFNTLYTPEDYFIPADPADPASVDVEIWHSITAVS